MAKAWLDPAYLEWLNAPPPPTRDEIMADVAPPIREVPQLPVAMTPSTINRVSSPFTLGALGVELADEYRGKSPLAEALRAARAKAPPPVRPEGSATRTTPETTVTAAPQGAKSGG